MKTINKIKQILEDGDIITEADKSNTLVIIPQNEYIEKRMKFLGGNHINIKMLTNDPSIKYCKSCHKPFTYLISEATHRLSKPINPSAPLFSVKYIRIT